MIIWSRFGILGLILPAVVITLCQAILNPVLIGDPKPIQFVKATDDPEIAPTAEEAEAYKAALRNRAAEREVVEKRADKKAFAVACLLSGGALWPLGRWMNVAETRPYVDVYTRQLVQPEIGGGHTLFFIPLQYWAFIWPVIGLIKLAS